MTAPIPRKKGETVTKLCNDCGKVEVFTAKRKYASGNYRREKRCDKCTKIFDYNRKHQQPPKPLDIDTPLFQVIMDNPKCNQCDVQIHCERRVVDRLRKLYEV